MRPGRIVADLVHGKRVTYTVAADGKLVRAAPPAGARAESLLRPAMRFFLPSGYPASVTADYLPHQLWSVAKNTASSAAYVLSTHALLTALGVQGSVAVPVSALANWVLKDGLGSAGVMLAASRLGKAMDSHLKTSRWLSEWGMVLGTTLEMLTPLVPAVAFLPLASVANTFKGLGGLTNGASKAALHRHFARDGNLAELTAQSHSQATACYMVGTAAGLGLTALHAPWLCFACVSAVQLWSAHRAIAGVALRTVDALRMPELVRAHFAQRGALPTPEQMTRIERWRWPFGRHSAVAVGASVAVFGDAARLERAVAQSGGKPFLLHHGERCVSAVLRADVTDEQIAEAAFEALKLCHGYTASDASFATFRAALLHSGWRLDEGLSLETSSKRIRCDW